MGAIPSREVADTVYSLRYSNHEIGLIPLLHRYFNSDNQPLRDQFVRMRNDPSIRYNHMRDPDVPMTCLPAAKYTSEDLDTLLDLVEETLYDTNQAMIDDPEQRPIRPIPCAVCFVYVNGREESDCFPFLGRMINVIGYFGCRTHEKESDLGVPYLQARKAILKAAGDRTLERVMILSATMIKDQYCQAVARERMLRSRHGTDPGRKPQGPPTPLRSTRLGQPLAPPSPGDANGSDESLSAATGMESGTASARERSANTTAAGVEGAPSPAFRSVIENHDLDPVDVFGARIERLPLLVTTLWNSYPTLKFLYDTAALGWAIEELRMESEPPKLATYEKPSGEKGVILKLSGTLLRRGLIWVSSLLRPSVVRGAWIQYVLDETAQLKDKTVEHWRATSKYAHMYLDGEEFTRTMTEHLESLHKEIVRARDTPLDDTSVWKEAQEYSHDGKLYRIFDSPICGPFLTTVKSRNQYEKRGKKSQTNSADGVLRSAHASEDNVQGLFMYPTDGRGGSVGAGSFDTKLPVASGMVKISSAAVNRRLPGYGEATGNGGNVATAPTTDMLHDTPYGNGAQMMPRAFSVGATQQQQQQTPALAAATMASLPMSIPGASQGTGGGVGGGGGSLRGGTSPSHSGSAPSSFLTPANVSTPHAHGLLDSNGSGSGYPYQGYVMRGHHSKSAGNVLDRHTSHSQYSSRAVSMDDIACSVGLNRAYLSHKDVGRNVDGPLGASGGTANHIGIAAQRQLLPSQGGPPSSLHYPGQANSPFHVTMQHSQAAFGGGSGGAMAPQFVGFTPQGFQPHQAVQGNSFNPQLTPATPSGHLGAQHASLAPQTGQSLNGGGNASPHSISAAANSTLSSMMASSWGPQNMATFQHAPGNQGFPQNMWAPSAPSPAVQTFSDQGAPGVSSGLQSNNGNHTTPMNSHLIGTPILGQAGTPIASPYASSNAVADMMGQSMQSYGHVGGVVSNPGATPHTHTVDAAPDGGFGTSMPLPHTTPAALSAMPNVERSFMMELHRLQEAMRAQHQVYSTLLLSQQQELMFLRQQLLQQQQQQVAQPLSPPCPQEQAAAPTQSPDSQSRSVAAPSHPQDSAPSEKREGDTTEASSLAPHVLPDSAAVMGASHVPWLSALLHNSNQQLTPSDLQRGAGAEQGGVAVPLNLNALLAHAATAVEQQLLPDAPGPLPARTIRTAGVVAPELSANKSTPGRGLREKESVLNSFSSFAPQVSMNSLENVFSTQLSDDGVGVRAPQSSHGSWLPTGCLSAPGPSLSSGMPQSPPQPRTNSHDQIWAEDREYSSTTTVPHSSLGNTAETPSLAAGDGLHHHRELKSSPMDPPCGEGAVSSGPMPPVGVSPHQNLNDMVLSLCSDSDGGGSGSHCGTEKDRGTAGMTWFMDEEV